MENQLAGPAAGGQMDAQKQLPQQWWWSSLPAQSETAGAAIDALAME
jgi:hypothetical protein